MLSTIFSAWITSASAETVSVAGSGVTTENGAISYSSLSQKGGLLPTPTKVTSQHVAFFFKTVRDLSRDKLDTLLADSYSADRLTTLKLIFQLRDVRGGKGERKLFLDCADWLIGHGHVSDVITNLKLIPEYGRWLDIIELLNLKRTDDSFKSFTASAVALLMQQLTSDLANMGNGQAVSLLAKWFPSEGKHHYNSGADGWVAQLLKALGDGGVDKATFRKKWLAPLREYINIVERLMCSKRFEDITYSKVPSQAMRRLKKAFQRNDTARFTKFMEDLNAGKETVKSATVFPHQLVKEYLESGRSAEQHAVTEAQWQGLIKTAKQSSKLTNVLGVCDVSGSMSGTPMEVSIALGIFLAELAKEPFAGKVITFSGQPEYHCLDNTTSLFQRVCSLSRAKWEMNTDLAKVFELILKTAVDAKVPQTDMPQTLIIFSDMQFDSCIVTRGGKTHAVSNLDNIKRRYFESGYQLPHVVFWNLRANTVDFPAPSCTEVGISLVSGFSPSILSSLMDGVIPTGIGLVEKIVSAKRYDAIV